LFIQLVAPEKDIADDFRTHQLKAVTLPDGLQWQYHRLIRDVYVMFYSSKCIEFPYIKLDGLSTETTVSSIFP
jgi:hypothetical protein